MRPIKLTMSGFGPYLKETIVNFEALGKSGLYLISGETGSGKTMIFDAITYALYGVTSGKVRDSKSLRSTSATVDERTEVCFEFEFKGNRYIAKRNTEYERSSKRGKGKTVIEPAHSELHCPDGEIFSGSGGADDQVSQKIKELFSLNYDQFQKIAIIPQGKFMELIQANTSERQRIFRDIFNTDIFQRFQDLLEKRHSICNEELRREYDKLANCYSNIKFSEDVSSELKAKIEAKKKDKFLSRSCLSDDDLSLVNELIASDEKLLSSCKNDLKLYEKEQEGLQKSLEALRRRKIAEAELRSREEQKEKLLQRRSACELRKKENEARKPEAEEAQDKASKLELTIDKYEARDKRKREYKEKASNLATVDKNIEKLKYDIQKYSGELENINKRLESLGNPDVAIGENELKKEKIEQRGKVLKNLSSNLKKLQKYSLDLKTEQDKFYKSQAKYEKANCEYQNCYNKFIAGQAGILASTVKEGEPCPVCGSISHPRLAHNEEHIPSQTDVDKAKSKTECANNERIEVSKSCNQIKGQYNAIIATLISNESDDLFALNIQKYDVNDQSALEEDIRAIERRLNELRAQYNLVEQEIKRAKGQKAEKESSEKKAKDLEKERIPELDNDLRKAEEEKAKLKVELEGLKTSISELDGELEYENADRVKYFIDLYRKNASEIREAIRKSDADFIETEKYLEVCNSEISKAKNIVSELSYLDCDSLETRDSELKTLLKSLHIKIANIDNILKYNKDTYNELETLRFTVESKNRKTHKLLHLCNLFKGNSSKEDKLSLENYILASYFDNIVDRANQWYITMSKGRYELVRRDKASDKRSQFGLDLDVFDNYDGKKRPIQTLSGGESFMAALSLALGLADEIQENAGGIQIDALFIDEGFGTLDSSALDQAYRALEHLKDGNRFVGIISHVEELKRRIDEQILVKKLGEGRSTAEIITFR